DIFAAADDHLLDTAGDMKSAVGPHSGQVAGVQPALRVYSARGSFWLAIIAFHDQVTARAELATLINRDSRSAAGSDNFNYGFRRRPSNRRDARLQIVIHIRHSDQRGTFRLTVADRDLGTMHLHHDASHDFDRAWRSGHDDR